MHVPMVRTSRLPAGGGRRRPGASAKPDAKLGDASARPQLVAAQEKFSTMRAEIDRQLERLFEAQDLDGIHSALNRRRYISNLVREVDKELNVHVSD